MKLLILGATGGTGKSLVSQALEQNHQVTALVRDPGKLNVHRENLTVIKGNVLDRENLAEVLKGKDIVLSALGVGANLKSNNLITNSVNLLIPAMNDAQVRRLIFLSAFGVGKTYAQSSLPQKIVFRFIIDDLYRDKARAEEALQKSKLDWTLVYPVKLNDGPCTKKYKVGEQMLMKGFPAISRADVAHFMLSQLVDNTFLKKQPILMN